MPDDLNRSRPTDPVDAPQLPRLPGLPQLLQLPRLPRLRIAMLTHSVNPRGGVVHALALGDALQALGHDVTVFAPDPHGQGLFRQTRCRFDAVGMAAADANINARVVAAGPDDIVAMVRCRIDDYLRHFETVDAARFDVYHAQDSISANALAVLAERGTIAGYVRTVHHLDHFSDPTLAAWQERGFRQAGQLLCVSRTWQTILAQEHGVHAECVANGVDTTRFLPRDAVSPRAAQRDQAVRARYGLQGAPVFLAVGGFEARKNTLALLHAFIAARKHRHPDAQLVIAGGASILDHAAYRQRCLALLAENDLTPFDASQGAPPMADRPPVIVTGTVDDADMPSLYRCADALLFPSLKEGFGLVVLEAMASGIPVIVSNIAPFTEYLDADDVAWVDPRDPDTIVDAMRQVCEPSSRAAWVQAGHRRAAGFSWRASALRHDTLYRTYLHQHPYRMQEVLDA